MSFHVKFEMNSDIDEKVTQRFWNNNNDKGGGVYFGANIREEHPDLSSADPSVVHAYVSSWYALHHQLMEERRERFQKEWDEVEQPFMQTTQDLFHGFSWPDGAYNAYLSYINCNPRDIVEKKFQVYWKKEKSVQTTAHELMHFMFYAYTEERFASLVKELDKDNGLWWDVAEIFNAVVLSSDQYKNLLHIPGDPPYPAHEQYMERARDLYQENADVDVFIPALFELVKND